MEGPSSTTPPSAETPVAFLTRVNNEVATESMARGELKTSFDRLQEAIRLVSSTLSGRQDDQDEDSTLSNASMIHLEAVPSPGCDPLGIVSNSGVVGSAFKIQDTGFAAHQQDDQHATLQIVSAVAIFNMALIYHLQLLETSSCRMREVLLKRSLFLYRQVFQLWEDDSSPMYLSLCQNCVVISVDAGHIEQANEWKDRLSDAIKSHYPVCPLPFLLCHSATFGASQAA